MALSDDSQVQAMIQNMPEKTGKPVTEWFKILADSGLEKHGEMMKLLKGEYGVTHGYANMIIQLYRAQDATEAPTESDLLTAQYAGAKAAMRPIYDAVLAAVTPFGTDVVIAPKKTYVSLRRSKQFAIVQASAKDRVDVGLNLKDVESTERLEGGTVFGGMCTRLVRLGDPVDVDEELIAWLRQAYDQAG